MKFKNTSPTVYVYAPNRTTLYGSISEPLHLNIDYRFNTFSQMEFEIRKFYYDVTKEKWVENPLYNNIEKNNLIKIPNDNTVFSYKIRELYDDDEYCLREDVIQPNKLKDTHHSINEALTFNPLFYHCSLQSETELFDVGALGGYGWNCYKQIDSGSKSDGSIDPKSGGYIINSGSKLEIANENYFPVKVGDIIAMGSELDNTKQFIRGGNYLKFAYCPFFYLNADSSSCVHIGMKNYQNDDTNYYQTPVGRYRVKNGDLGSYTYKVNGNTIVEYIKEGYVRFQGKCLSSSGENTLLGKGMIKIFSGERRCDSIDTKSPVTLQHGIPWWVIVNVEENKDGVNPVKKITAYSYEYTLSNRTFSIEDDTVPLYIPDNIPNIVNSDNFLIDRWSDQTYKGAQRMKRGLLNQILDNLSGWKVRYVSNGVCTRYRQVSDVDNANIYTFLMNTVQKLYQCCIMFDVENLYINIIDQTSLINDVAKSGVMLSWRNALKSMTIKDIDDNYATALKIYSEEDTYGLGLVNPNGTNTIYNFDNIIDKLDYVVDENHLNGSTPFTLKELINIYKTTLSNNLSNYKSYANALIENNLKLVKYKTRLSETLNEYQKKVDENNVVVKLKYNSDGIPETPPDANLFNADKRWCWQVPTDGYGSQYHNETYNGTVVHVWDFWASRQNHDEVQKAAENYWDIYDTCTNCENEVAKNIYQMKQISTKLSLNINTLKKQFANNNTNGVPTDNYAPVFTPTEAVELYKYIYESTWTNENITFNEKYSADDIYDTLVDLYNSAKTELDKIYSKSTYDFESDIANIIYMPEMKEKCNNLFLGSSIYIYDDTKWIEPVLLELKIQYDEYSSSPMVFTTNYNRKPKEMRFYELFSTINQVSVETPTYTFDG